MFKFKPSNEINLVEAIGVFFALIFSIASLVNSVRDKNYDINKDIQENKESIAITFDKISYDEYARYNVYGGYRGQGLVGVKYTVFVSNNSKQRVSILKYDLYQSINDSLIQYGNLLESVLDTNNEKVLFPISLDAGDSKRLVLDLNVSVPQNVNILVQNKFGIQDRISFSELKDYLGEQGTDIYGNTVKYTKYGNGTVLMEIDKPHFPVYIFKMTSSKNNVFTQTISEINEE